MAELASSRRVAVWAALLVVALVGMFPVWHRTRHNVGVGNDATHFLSAAENLRHGNGLDVSFSSGFDPEPTAQALERYGRVPMTHYPPGYPVALAAVDVATPGSTEDAARLVGLLCVPIAVTAAYAIARHAGAGRVPAIATAALVGFAPSLIRLSMWAMSDALGAVLVLAALAVTPVGPRSARREWAAGLLAAAAMSVRWSGVTAAASVLLMLALSRPFDRAFVRSALRAVAPTVVVFVGTFLYGSARSADSTRPIAWHPPGRRDLDLLRSTLGEWVLAQRPGWRSDFAAVAVTLLIIGCCAGALIAVLRRRTGLASPRLVVLVGLASTVVGQLVVLVATSTWFDADVSFDQRVMLTAELAVLAMAGVAFTVRRAEVFVAVAAVVIVLRITAPTGPFPQGLDTPGTRYDPDPAFDLLTTLPAGAPIVTNVPESVWRETGLSSIVAPAPYDKLSDLATPGFEQKVVEMGSLVGERGGYLFLYRIETPRALSIADAERLLPCATGVFEDDIGVVYSLASCS